MSMHDVNVLNGGRAIANSLNFIGKVPEHCSVAVINTCSGRGFWYRQHIGKRVILEEALLIPVPEGFNKESVRHFGKNMKVHGSVGNFYISKKDIKIVSQGPKAKELGSKVEEAMQKTNKRPRLKVGESGVPVVIEEDQEKLWTEVINIIRNEKAMYQIKKLKEKFKLRSI